MVVRQNQQPQSVSISVTPVTEPGVVTVEWQVQSDVAWEGEINIAIRNSDVPAQRRTILGTGNDSGSVSFAYPDIQEEKEALLTGIVQSTDGNVEQSQRDITIIPSGTGGPFGDVPNEVLLTAAVLGGGGAVLVIQDLFRDN